MSLLLLLKGTPSTPSAAYRITDIPDALLGTKKILVWNGSQIKQRVTTEGTPLVVVGGQLRQLLSTETLQS